MGNALGVAILEIPFLAALGRGQQNGMAAPEAYTSAFASVAASLTVVLIVVVLLLRLLPSRPTD